MKERRSSSLKSYVVAAALIAAIALLVLDRRWLQSGVEPTSADSADDPGAQPRAVTPVTSVSSSGSEGASSSSNAVAGDQDRDVSGDEPAVIEGAADDRVTIPFPDEFRVELARNTGLAEFHARLEREPEDAQWAARIERLLEEHITSTFDLSRFRVLSVECRTSACEVLAMGYGNEALRVWMEGMGELFETDVLEGFKEGNGRAGCGGGDAGPGVFALSCTLEWFDPAVAQPTAPSLSVDAPYPEGVSFERVGVQESLVPLIETSEPVYELHRRLELEATDLSWADYIEPLMTEYIASLEHADQIDNLTIACRTSLCEVQIIARGSEVFVELSSRMIEFHQLGWHSLSTAGMTGRDIEDGATGLVWMLERSAP